MTKPEPVNREAELRWVLNELKSALADAKPGEVASLVKQYREAVAELDNLTDAPQTDRVDDLAKRRRSRTA